MKEKGKKNAGKRGGIVFFCGCAEKYDGFLSFFDKKAMQAKIQ